VDVRESGGRTDVTEALLSLVEPVTCRLDVCIAGENTKCVVGERLCAPIGARAGKRKGGAEVFTCGCTRIPHLEGAIGGAQLCFESRVNVRTRENGQEARDFATV